VSIGRRSFLVFVVALVLRLLYLCENSESPYFHYPVLDEVYLDNLGVQIAEGNASHDEAYFRAPLYPLFLGTVYSFSVEHRFFLIRLVQHLLGALTCVLLMLIAEGAFGRRAGLIAGLVSACYGPLIFYEGEILIVSVFTLLIALALALLVRGSLRGSLLMSVAGGTALGLAVITRPNILPFVPVVFCWSLFLPGMRGWLRRLGGAFLIVLQVAVLVGCTAVRNYVAAGDFVLVSSQGGINFYLGNTVGQDPERAGLPPPAVTTYRPVEDYRDTVEMHSKDKLEEVAKTTLSASQVSEFWYRMAWEEIRRHKGAWLKLTIRKAMLFWNDYEAKNNKNYYFCKRYSRLLRVLPVSYGILAVFSLYGLVLTVLRRPSHASVLLILFVPAFMLSIVAFFVCARLRLPVVVGLIPLAAHGVARFADMLRGSRRKLLAHGAMICVLGLVVLPDWYGIRPDNFRQEFWTVGQYYLSRGMYDEAIESFTLSLVGEPPGELRETYLYLGHSYLQADRPGSAMVCYRRALEKMPGDPRVLNAMGVAFERSGEYEEAVGYYRQALALSSGYARAMINLGLVLLGTGDVEEAGDLLRAAQCLDDSDPDAYLGLALHSRLTGDGAKAEEYLRAAVERGGEEYLRMFTERLAGM